MKKHTKRIRQLAPYVFDVADKMKLRDWSIRVSDRPATGDSLARCHCVFGRKLATIYLAKSFWKLLPEEQRQTICHELIHVHFSAMSIPLENHLTKFAHTFYINSMELGVDALSDVIASAMPLPPQVA